ncbi:hypothetical protein IEQ34_026289 [Dendrobium chrysotoxum]|uniref:Uncharacterized protein n=1 Tax=Dendrobium chrysotoxum TaxID=161865 RepID=A0AAV7FM11_DENCH|nr:hypothetical protein IEQ34_026289 [Dendrobium chrysotoxum]
MQIMKNHKTELPEMPVPIRNPEPSINSNGTLCKVPSCDMSYYSLITYSTPNIRLHFPTEMENDYRDCIVHPE